MMASVGLSVACLDLTRQWKGLGSSKLARWKPIARATREPILFRGQKVKGQGQADYCCHRQCALSSLGSRREFPRRKGESESNTGRRRYSFLKIRGGKNNGFLKLEICFFCFLFGFYGFYGFFWFLGLSLESQK